MAITLLLFPSQQIYDLMASSVSESSVKPPKLGWCRHCVSPRITEDFYSTCFGLT